MEKLQQLRTLTKVSQTKRDRMALFFDDEFDFSVDLETFVKEDIKVGQKYSEEDYAVLCNLTQYQSIKAKAFRLLSARSYTYKMLEEKLERDFDAEEVEQVLRRICELGLLDDRDYALRYARDLVHLKQFSLYRVRQQLRQKGIGEEWIEEALAQFSEIDPETQIASLVCKKYRSSLDSEKGLRRTTSSLLRRGYAYSEIKTVLSHLLEDPDYYVQ